jgi:hypothetical protein
MKKTLFTISIVMLMVGIAIGDGIAQEISVFPGEQDFGNIMMGNSSSLQPFTITNTGAANLVVRNISLEGMNPNMFSWRTDTCPSTLPITLETKASCAITATFSPTSGGAKSTTLKIVSNASNSPAVGVPLTGTGLQPLNVGLVLYQTTYNFGELIKVTLTLQNPGGEIITSKGFKDKPFDLYLIFFDPDGKTITSQLLQDTDLKDPPPPRVFVLPSGELAPNLDPVEKLEAGWVQSVNIPNALAYYPLSKGGDYSVTAMIPMRTYPDIDYTDSGTETNPHPPVDYSWIDHRNSEGALESNIVNFTLLAPAVTYRIVINPSSSTIIAGGRQSYTATGYDQNNNSLGDVTAVTTFSITNGTCRLNVCTSNVAGNQTVTGSNNGKTATASLGVYSTTAITLNAPSVVYGKNGIVTVSVSSSAVTPEGNVALSVDGGSAVSQPLSSGSTTFTVSKPSAGDHTLNAAYAAQGYFYGSSGTGKLSVGKAGQTITFLALPIKMYGDPDFDPGATASSGLPVSYTSSNPAVATIVSGKIHIVGAGTSTITASQAGDANYNAAANVSQSLTVAKANQTITFAPLLNKTYGNPPFTVSASASSGLPVSFSIVSGPATISGSTVTITGVGTVTVRASQVGNENYNPAPSVDRSFQVSQVSYVFTGFFSPVDNPPTVNNANGGQAIPVKWRITDANGAGISDPSSFVGLISYKFNNCDWTGSAQDPITESTSGASGLQYLGNGNWQFNWKTAKGYANTCRMLILNLKDGTQHKAEFKFK